MKLTIHLNDAPIFSQSGDYGQVLKQAAAFIRRRLAYESLAHVVAGIKQAFPDVTNDEVAADIATALAEQCDVNAAALRERAIHELSKTHNLEQRALPQQPIVYEKDGVPFTIE